MTVKEFDNLFAVNVRAPYFLVQQLLPILGERALAHRVTAGRDHVRLHLSPVRPIAGDPLAAERAGRFRPGAEGRHPKRVILTVNGMRPGAYASLQKSRAASRQFTEEIHNLRRVGFIRSDGEHQKVRDSEM
jgi:NAD(P)-dependent dehydrogenase (short-subunit alcohol dehydrogenase family)